MKATRIVPLLAFLVLTLTLVSCAPEGPGDRTYSLFSGLAHGFILPFAIIGKLFGMDHGLYAVNNSGFLYWLGYFFGYLLITGGIGFGGGRRYYVRRRI
jgi:hypothetical protein